MREYLLTLLVAATFTYLAVGLVRAGAVRAGILAEIRDRDVHDVPIPQPSSRCCTASSPPLTRSAASSPAPW